MTDYRRSTRLLIRAATVIALSLCIIAGGVPTVNAHNIDVAKARDKAREYARQKVADPNRAYEHFTTDCLAAFPGHNHIVRCSIFYFDDSRNQLCKERVEVYVEPHKKTISTNTWSNEMFIRPTAAKGC